MKKRDEDHSSSGIGIGDVSKICGIPVHTIRYWEREFEEFLCPTRTAGKQRRYQDADIAKILQIKKLLWSDRFSIKGAKKILGLHYKNSWSLKAGSRYPFGNSDISIPIEAFIGDTLSITESVA